MEVNKMTQEQKEKVQIDRAKVEEVLEKIRHA